MAGSELWVSLCHNLTPLIRLGVPEETYQQLFEAQLKTTFSWDETGMQRKVLIPVGSAGKLEGDIVLSGPDTKMVIEMKKPGVALTPKQAGQLKSYMKLTSSKFGLLVGDRIKVYYDDDSTDETVEVADIPFDLKSEEGADLATVLRQANFSEVRLRDFCVKQIKRAESAKEMAELKELLLANGGLRIKEIVKSKLVQDGYKEPKIDALLADIQISQDDGMITPVKKSKPVVKPKSPAPPPSQLSGRVYQEHISENPVAESPVFILENKKNNVYARAQMIDGKFTVLPGSLVAFEMIQPAKPLAASTVSAAKSKATLLAKLIEEGAISGAPGNAKVTKRIEFNSPSEAGAVIQGRASCNGLNDWRTQEGLITFGAWQLSGITETE